MSASISIHGVRRILIERASSGADTKSPIGWFEVIVVEKDGTETEISLFFADGKQPEIEGAEFFNFTRREV